MNETDISNSGLFAYFEQLDVSPLIVVSDTVSVDIVRGFSKGLFKIEVSENLPASVGEYCYRPVFYVAHDSNEIVVPGASDPFWVFELIVSSGSVLAFQAGTDCELFYWPWSRSSVKLSWDCYKSLKRLYD